MESSFLDDTYTLGVIPVLQIDQADHAIPVAEALLSGGLPVAESRYAGMQHLIQSKISLKSSLTSSLAREQ